MKKILIIAVNPRDSSRLRLDREIRDVEEAIRLSRYRDEFKLTIQLATRPVDLRRVLLEIEPHIVHFCGHGEGQAGLVLEDDTGQPKLINTEALSQLFALFANTLECVLLNACYSEVQADAIVQHINYVIGMSREIRDDAAIAFAVGFYDAIGAGKTVEFAFNLGCVAIQTEIQEGKTGDRKLVPVDGDSENLEIAEHLKPVLKKKESLTSKLTSAASNLEISPSISGRVSDVIFIRKCYISGHLYGFKSYLEDPNLSVQRLYINQAVKNEECRKLLREIQIIFPDYESLNFQYDSFIGQERVGIERLEVDSELSITNIGNKTIYPSLLDSKDPLLLQDQRWREFYHNWEQFQSRFPELINSPVDVNLHYSIKLRSSGERQIKISPGESVFIPIKISVFLGRTTIYWLPMYYEALIWLYIGQAFCKYLKQEIGELHIEIDLGDGTLKDFSFQVGITQGQEQLEIESIDIENLLEKWNIIQSFGEKEQLKNALKAMEEYRQGDDNQ